MFSIDITLFYLIPLVIIELFYFQNNYISIPPGSLRGPLHPHLHHAPLQRAEDVHWRDEQEPSSVTGGEVGWREDWGTLDLSDFYVEAGTVDDRSGVSCQDWNIHQF